MQPLPIDPLIPRLVEALTTANAVVLTAAPGAGKSTRVPPALAKHLPGSVLLLQPRRLAATSLAKRIAAEQGWRLGSEVGYRVRFERKGDANTKLWVMTEGTLTRQFASDPYLEGVSAVVLDEFHERSLHTDLALAYLRDLQSIRDDFKLVVMSATMDAAPVAAYLGGAPILDAPGTTHPVAVRHWMQGDQLPLPERVASAVMDATLDPDCGDILVFLPGMGEIRATERALAAKPLGEREVLPLHGSLPADDQDRALNPGNRPRVVLSTNVAETSVTIPGVRTVIDSGLARIMHHDPATGVDELRLESISRFSATQRAGRAGRTAPGRCWRLWTPTFEARMPQATPPELRRSDLSGLLLALKRLGYADSRRFPWFEAPEPARLDSAEALLHSLGATPSLFAPLTELGERLVGLPLPPRLGVMLHHAARAQTLQSGATLAALCAERDIRVPPRPSDPPADPAPCDALDRMERLAEAERLRFAPHLRDRGTDANGARQVAQARADLLRAWQGASGGWSVGGREREATPDELCRLLLAAFPDRVAKRSASDPNRATMLGGVSLEIDRGSALFSDRGQNRGPLLLAIEVQEIQRSGKTLVVVRQAAEISEADLASSPDGIQRRTDLFFDESRERVVERIRWCYRDLAIREAAGEPSDAEAASRHLIASIAPRLRAIISEDEATARWLTRVAWLARQMPDLNLPVIDDALLTEVMAECASGCLSLADVRARKPIDWLQAKLDARQAQALDEHAPDTIEVPSGSHIRIQYQDDGPPILAVRLQEMFGCTATPRLAGGRVPVLLHLLAPNYRPEQITTDLASFWANTYALVRKDLRCRYPKHSWPDDPLTAPAVAKGRPRQ
jgi:ATP-dependent helicase HrpB